MQPDAIFLKQCNRILYSLPIDEWNRWLPHLQFVDLKTGTILFNQINNDQYIYFPITCIISLMCELENGSTVEFGHVGNEGMVGGHLLASTPPATRKVEVISAGGCYRIKSQVLLDELEKSGPFRRLLMRYMYFQMFTSAQLVICTRKHGIVQQVSKLLLELYDKISGAEITITQELISNMLGVRREGVSEAVSQLEKLNLIEHKRGSITVTDTEGLKHQACECYGLIQEEMSRMLPRTESL